VVLTLGAGDIGRWVRTLLPAIGQSGRGAKS
jgi:hypothetical protein